MAALDPRGEFRLAQGVPTAGNLNAAGGFPQLTVDGGHWLQVVSGGKLPAAGGGRFGIPWTDMWVAMLKIYSIDYAQHGTACMSRIITLNELHDAIMRCVMAGMAFTVIGSVEGALAAFVRYAREHAQSNPASWVLTAAQLQTLPAVPAAAPALPAPAEWFLHLEFGMALDQSGSPLTLAALLAVLPGWCSHLGRAGMAFEDSATELNDMVEASRPNWAATAPRRRALAIAAHGRGVQPVFHGRMALRVPLAGATFWPSLRWRHRASADRAAAGRLALCGPDGKPRRQRYPSAGSLGHPRSSDGECQ